MKRYFDISKDRITLELDVNEDGMKYSLEEVENSLKISGLREINKEEFDKLTSKYVNEQR